MDPIPSTSSKVSGASGRGRGRAGFLTHIPWEYLAAVCRRKIKANLCLRPQPTPHFWWLRHQVAPVRGHPLPPPRPWVTTTAAGRLFQARGPSAFRGRPLSRRVPGPKRPRRSDPSRSHRPSDRHGSTSTTGVSTIKSRPGRGLLRSRLRVDEVGEIFADLYPAPFPDAIHDLEDVMHGRLARSRSGRSAARRPSGRRASWRPGTTPPCHRPANHSATETCRASSAMPGPAARCSARASSRGSPGGTRLPAARR